MLISVLGDFIWFGTRRGTKLDTAKHALFERCEGKYFGFLLRGFSNR